MTWGFACGADDGNRTRVFSLGTRVIMLESGPDLRMAAAWLRRSSPWLTGLNGPLMARRVTSSPQSPIRPVRVEVIFFALPTEHR